MKSGFVFGVNGHPANDTVKNRHAKPIAAHRFVLVMLFLVCMADSPFDSLTSIIGNMSGMSTRYVFLRIFRMTGQAASLAMGG